MQMFLHMAIHLITGGTILLIFLNKRLSLTKDYIITFVLGSIIAITPDITKYFGDILLHSLATAPLIGAAYGWIIYKTLNVRFFWAWISTMATLFIGHLLIDLLGNGINLFYPFMNQEQNFAILGSNNELIISALLTIATTITLIYKKVKPLAIVSLVLAASFVVSLGISNAIISYSLQQRYSFNDPQYIIVYPDNTPFHWNYYVRIDELTIISGKGSYFTVTK
ncbi:metal-dependent hydrolase [Paenibacillus sp. 1781tsa1]|uniref:metal-dependent hydrolase n=1 Tax=Paenibacillus sp. 1781tsa1 TaxID=2953810 RepID=UPI0020A11131|nr:metal-dependent hydrolase [Paenibacillus sp. 1781tsa1]MCP1182360.1 metal-dependent hydrolase [Paenibacillus sp. 1781tsa1]